MKPQVTEQIDGYVLSWEDGMVSIKVSRLDDHSDGRLTGELLISTNKPGFGPVLMPATQINFTAERTRASLIKNLTETFPDFPSWAIIINQLTHYVQGAVRKGEPVQELWTHEEIQKPEYLLEPLLFKGLPNAIFGEKGVSKSTMSLIAYICLLLPWTENHLGFTAPAHSTPSLILDWETESNVVQYYAKRLQIGMNLPSIPIFYRRCTAPLTDNIEQIQKHIVDTKSEVVIIDSLGAAAGGELNKPEIALKFFAALRKLKVTSLIIGQTSKSEDKKKHIFGSVYFEYYCRNIFELCKSEDGEDEDDVTLALFHKASNLSRKHKPMGFRLHYNEVGIEVESQAVTYGEFLEKVSTKLKIEEILRNGVMSSEEIKEALSLSPVNLRVTLKRLKDANKIIKVGEKWGLRSFP